MARVNQHLFSYSRGSHKIIWGFHTLTYNCVAKCDGVFLNYFNSVGHKSISVILSGPFTATQKVKVKQCKIIRVHCVKEVLKWLMANNILYYDVNVDNLKIIQPHITDCSTEVGSENSNIEQTYEITVVFADQLSASTHSAGFDMAGELKSNQVDDLINCESTLISRSSTSILKDYEGENLLKAFVLQFHFGIGSQTRAGDKQGGKNYYKCLSLSSRSSCHFHRPGFCVLMYNMTQRKTMITQAYLRTTEDQC